jgi:hypothetical protein
MKTLVYVRLNLEDMLIYDCLGAIPDKDTEGRCPRNKDIPLASDVTTVRLAVK